MGKREFVFWCLVIVLLFLAVPWVCLQFVIVVFPDHTHYFYYRNVYRLEVKKVTDYRKVFRLKVIKITNCRKLYRLLDITVTDYRED